MSFLSSPSALFRTLLTLLSNHVECRCGQNFCYICGKEAFDRLGSNHWAAGGCPRYHSAGSANAIYDPDDDDEEDILQLSFDTWAWNMAMQHSDPTMQADMRRILRHTLEDQAPPIPTLQNVRDVLRGLESYHVEHGVDPTEWASLVDQYRGDTILRVTRVPAQSTLFQNTSPVRYGVLSRPVGGVFNLASGIGQSSAHSWAGRVWRAYGAETRESFENYAVFDFGPGGDLAYREAVAEVIDILRTQGHMLSNGRLAFDTIPMSGNAILVEITGQRPIFEDGHPALPGFSDMSNPLTPLMVFISNPTVLEGHEDLFQRRLQDIEKANEIVRAEAADRATERLRLELHRLDAHILNLDSMTDLEMEAEIDIWRRVRAEPLPEQTSSPLFEEQHFALSSESVPAPAPSLPAQPLADADEWLAEMTRFEQILLEDLRQTGGEQHQRNNPHLVNGADLIDVGAHPEQAQMEPRSWQELVDSANRIALPEGQQEASGDSSEETGWGLQELADRTNNFAQDDRQEDAGAEDGSAQAISWMELADQANEINREDADVEEAIDRFLGLFDEPGDELLNDGVAGGEAR